MFSIILGNTTMMSSVNPIMSTIGFISMPAQLKPSRFSKKVSLAKIGSSGSGKGSGWRLCVSSARAFPDVALTSSLTVGHTLCVSSTSSRYEPGATACSLKLPS